MRKLMFLLIPGILVACVACQVPSPLVLPTQTPGTVHLEGDSVTFNTYYGTNVSHSWLTTESFCPGATIDNSGYCTDLPTALTRVPQLVQQGKVDKLVWALGLNEIAREGWSIRYQLLWTDMLTNQVPDESCVVIVKPWILPIANKDRPLEAMNAIRKWIDDMAALNPNFVVVDWKPDLESHPEYASGDGVHLIAGSGAAEARDAMYREGLSLCG